MGSVTVDPMTEVHIPGFMTDMGALEHTYRTSGYSTAPAQRRLFSKRHRSRWRSIIPLSPRMHNLTQ